jgi:hypothetical protein
MNTVLTMLTAFLVVLSPLLAAAAVVRVTRWIGTRPGRHRRRRSWRTRVHDLVTGGHRTLADGDDPHSGRNVFDD